MPAATRGHPSAMPPRPGPAAVPPSRPAGSPDAAPPAALRTMAAFWEARLAELEGSIAAETRPERLAPLAVERMCVHGILAGLDGR